MLVKCSVCNRYLVGGFWLDYSLPKGARPIRITGSVCPNCKRKVARHFVGAGRD